MRQPILYAEQMWRSQRIYPIGLMLIGLVIGIATLTVPALRTQRGGLSLGGTVINSSFIWLAYIPAGALLGGLYLLNRWRSAAEVTEQGLRVQSMISSTLIPYELVRSVRVQPLDRHFQDARKRSIRPVNRALLPKPALFLRLRVDDAQGAQIVKRLGSQLAAGDTVALPIPDPDAMSWEISARLPERGAANLGGRRRRKRSR